VLRAWYEQCGKPPADSPGVRDLWPTDDKRWQNHEEAKIIREDLRACGVKR
jgi:hypothetical protein